MEQFMDSNWMFSSLGFHSYLSYCFEPFMES